MIFLDLFETPGTPEQDDRPQSAYVPVNPEKPGARNRALGNANLAILMKAINNVDMNKRPAPLPAKINFLDGRSYTIEPKYYPAIIGYYRNINDVERVNFIYRTLVSYNKTIKFLNTLSQGTLFEKEEEKKSSKYKDVAVQRAMRQAVADFPSAASDTEAFAKSMMVQQDQDQQNIDRLKSASQRNRELINKNNQLDQSQARSIDDIQREIDKVEKDNDSLAQMIQQMNRANAELQDKLSRMRGRATATPAAEPAPEPQLGVSVATDKVVAPEPAADASPIDIGARQKINDLSKSVTSALLQLQNKEQAQGLTPSEQERLEKLETRLKDIEKAQSLIKNARQRGEKERKKAGDAAISAIAKAMGGDTTAGDVKAVEPTNIQPASTTPSNVYQLRKREPDVVKDLVVAPAGDQDTEEQPELKFKEDLTPGLEESAQEEFVFYINGKPAAKYQNEADALRDMALIKKKYPEAVLDLKQEVCDLETIRHIAEGSSLFEELPSKATYKLQQWKNQRNQQAQQSTQPQAEPVATTAPVEPQPQPARLSDLQSRHQKIEALFNLKKDIEIAKDKATKGGRILPRGLAADLEDYYSIDDIDTHYDQMLAAYQKQLKAIEQYLSMKKILNKKVTHEMRASELQETKSEVWTVHFTDGTAVRVRVSDETDPAAVRRHYANKGKTVAKFDYGYGSQPEAGPGPEAHEPGSERAVSARTGEPLPEDTKSEFKAVALDKIKRALANPKLDPATRKDFETRLQKIQALEEGRAGYNPLTSEKHWHEVERYLASQINDPKLDPQSKAEARQRYQEKRKEAQQKGWAK